MKWLEAVASDQGCSVSGARKARSDLEDSGYIELQERRAATGREKTVHLTEKGKRYARPFQGRFPNLSRFVPLNRLLRDAEAKRVRADAVDELSTAGAEPETSLTGRPSSSGTRSSPTRVTRSQEPNDETRIATFRKRNRINHHFRLSFVGRKRTFYFQLLTPPDEWISCEFYEQVMVGVDANGVPIYRSYTVVGKDSPYLSYFAKPKQRLFALGVGLNSTPAGFEIAHYTDEKQPVLSEHRRHRASPLQLLRATLPPPATVQPSDRGQAHRTRTEAHVRLR